MSEDIERAFLLEKVNAMAEIGELSTESAEAMRALLTAQPQASAAQCAPAGEREAFEAWWVSRPHRKAPSKYENGDYVAPSVHSAWEVWQGRAAWQRTQSAGEREESCDHCEPEGVFAIDGAGPFDCYACGKKAGAGEALDIVARAIDGPCRDVETIAKMSELICAELSAARWLRMAPADAIDFKVPITKVLGSFGLSVEDSEALAAEIAISLIPHLAQWAEDHLAAAPAQPAAQKFTDCMCGGGDFHGHTAECQYEHFLSYSSLKDDPLLRYAYIQGIGGQCEQPAAQDQGEVQRLREALELARPCVIRDMEAAVRENFGRVGNDPWACAAVDARDAIDAALSASAEGK